MQKASQKGGFFMRDEKVFSEKKMLKQVQHDGKRLFSLYVLPNLFRDLPLFELKFFVRV